MPEDACVFWRVAGGIIGWRTILIPIFVFAMTLIILSGVFLKNHIGNKVLTNKYLASSHLFSSKKIDNAP